MVQNVAVKDWKQIQEFPNRKSNSVNHYVARRYMIRPARACKYKRTRQPELSFLQPLRCTRRYAPTRHPNLLSGSYRLSYLTAAETEKIGSCRDRSVRKIVDYVLQLILHRCRVKQTEKIHLYLHIITMTLDNWYIPIYSIYPGEYQAVFIKFNMCVGCQSLLQQLWFFLLY